MVALKLLATTCLLLVSSFSSISDAAITQVPYTWSTVRMGGGGYVSGIITSRTQQGLIYIRTDVGGAYRFNATGQSWIPLLDWLSDSQSGYYGVESIAIDPKTPQNVYMLVGTSYLNGGNTAILRSTDYGNTFSVVPVPFQANGNGNGRNNGEKLAVDPNNGAVIYCGTRSIGLYKSIDSGATWNAVNSLTVPSNTANGISFVVVDPSSFPAGSTQSQRIFVGFTVTGTNNLFISQDGGNTFAPLAGNGGPSNSLLPQRATLAGDSSFLFIAYADNVGPGGGSNGQLWKYELSTGSWTNITPASINLPFSGISVDPKNSLRLVASTTNVYQPQYTSVYNVGVYGDRIYFSTNGGSSWTEKAGGMTLDTNGIPWINSYAIQWAGSIEFDPFNTTRVFVTSGNGIYLNENIDSTKTWKFIDSGLEETVVLDFKVVKNGPLLSVMYDVDGYRQDNATVYALSNYRPTMGSEYSIAYAGQNTKVVARVGSSIYKSLDGAVTWTQVSLPSGAGGSGQIAISADGNNFIYCPSGSTTTYVSTNQGSSWTTSTGVSVNSARPTADLNDADNVYIYDPSSGTVYMSSDGGVSFAAKGSTSSGGSSRIQVAPGFTGHVWIALYGNGLVYSINGGASFTKVSAVTSCSAVGFGMTAAGATYPTVFIWGTVGGVTGILRSVDQGATWVQVNDANHQFGGPGNGNFVEGDPNVFGRVYMATFGRGVVFGDVEEAVSASSSPSPVLLPSPSSASPAASLIPSPSSSASPHAASPSNSNSASPSFIATHSPSFSVKPSVSPSPTKGSIASSSPSPSFSGSHSATPSTHASSVSATPSSSFGASHSATSSPSAPIATTSASNSITSGASVTISPTPSPATITSAVTPATSVVSPTPVFSPAQATSTPSTSPSSKHSSEGASIYLSQTWFMTTAALIAISAIIFV